MQWLHTGKAGAPQTSRLRRHRAPEARQQQVSAGSRGAHFDGRSQLLGFKPYHAVNVPKHVNMQAVASHGGNQPKTTAMLRNIPNRYTQPTLLEEIDKLGFAGEYDFFYLPMDTHNRTNVGYAFINFVSQDQMESFARVFSGSNFKDHSSQKVARVSPAHVQGFYANVQQFWDRAVTHSRNSQYRPMVVLNGVRRDLSDAYQELFQPEFQVPQADFQADFGNPYYGCEDAEAGRDYRDYEVPRDYQDMEAPPGLEAADLSAEDLLPSFLRNSEEEYSMYGAQGQGEDSSACSPMWQEGSVYWPSDSYAHQSSQYGWSEDAFYAGKSDSEKAAAAKSDLEQALSKWLLVDACMHATSSTEGGSRTHSRTSSPRSGSEDAARALCRGPGAH